MRRYNKEFAERNMNAGVKRERRFFIRAIEWKPWNTGQQKVGAEP
jgi:hypothetical protein